MNIPYFYTARTSNIKPFSTCFALAVRAPTELILLYIGGIWSYRQNEPDFLKIGPELWSPGPKNRKKSKTRKSRFFEHFDEVFFCRKLFITLVFLGVEKHSWALKNSQTLCYSLNTIFNNSDKNLKHGKAKRTNNLVTRFPLSEANLT